VSQPVATGEEEHEGSVNNVRFTPNSRHSALQQIVGSL
jgi:hypothetical protein